MAFVPKVAEEEKEDFDFSTLKMIRNIPSSAWDVIEGTYDAVTNPIDTAQAIGKLGLSAGQFAQRKVGEGFSGIPKNPGEGEEMAYEFAGSVADRYGSWDAAKQTLQNDPVGVLLDASAAGTASRMPQVAKLARGMEPLNALKGAATGTMKHLIPESAPGRLYSSSSKFSTTLTPTERAKLVETALREKVIPSSGGIKKVDNRIDVLTSQLDDLITEATDAGTTIPVQVIGEHLDALRRTKGGVRLGNDTDIKAIDKIYKKFAESKSMKGRESLTPEELQNFKVEAYKDINWDSKRMTGTPVKEDAYKAMARGAKEGLESAVPGIEEVNKRLGDLYELRKPLSRAAARVENRNMFSIMAPLWGGAGGFAFGDLLGGGLGTAAGVGLSMMTSPKNKARFAIALRKIQDGDWKWLEDNKHLTEARLAAAVLGQANEQLIGDEE